MRPLDGIRVLDLTRVVAGPMATRILADQGAEVIKIEPPEGDLSRTFPPHSPGDMNPYFCQQNAGKRFCSVDLTAEGASQLLLDLAATCDVVVENFRPGVMAKYGLGADVLLRRQPGLVYCSITGFGQTGPWAGRRAYAPAGHLVSGLLEYDARKTDRPARQPALVLGDAVTAMLAAASINALLVQSLRTGVGGHLDVCMIESLVYMQEWVAVELAGGWVGTNNGACDQSPVLQLPDGRVWGIAGNPVTWFEYLPPLMNRPDLLTDPRFADPLTREAHRADLVQLIAEWAGSFDTFGEFLTVLEAGSPFAAAELRSIDDLAATDFAAHRQLFATTDAGFDVPARPALADGIGTTGHVAARGADNREVFAEILGLAASQLDALEASGVLISA
ncbi:MAG: CaiB/BaiF CoA-transferase family protein [Actinomycetota bacterium]|nr:CaiB/BaiF CoA-transferase family protein [Actinomycetota bacterium]